MHAGVVLYLFALQLLGNVGRVVGFRGRERGVVGIEAGLLVGWGICVFELDTVFGLSKLIVFHLNDDWSYEYINKTYFWQSMRILAHQCK